MKYIVVYLLSYPIFLLIECIGGGDIFLIQINDFVFFYGRKGEVLIAKIRPIAYLEHIVKRVEACCQSKVDF